MDDELDQTLEAVGPRLRKLRQERDVTLAELSESTGVSVSTLSRLESGARKPTPGRAAGVQGHRPGPQGVD